MAATTITLSKDYGYVLATAAGSFVLTIWHGLRVGGFRKAAGVPYPLPYALGPRTPQDKSAFTPEKEKAEYLFNCCQRAHANYLENYPIFLPAMLIGGLQYPIASAGLGVFWMVNRVIYAVGYTRADKEKGRGRLLGSGYQLGQLGVIFLAARVAYNLLTV